MINTLTNVCYYLIYLILIFNKNASLANILYNSLSKFNPIFALLSHFRDRGLKLYKGYYNFCEINPVYIHFFIYITSLRHGIFSFWFVTNVQRMLNFWPKYTQTYTYTNDKWEYSRFYELILNVTKGRLLIFNTDIIIYFWYTHLNY